MKERLYKKYLKVGDVVQWKSTCLAKDKVLDSIIFARGEN
jgi:hypothetical protein